MKPPQNPNTRPPRGWCPYTPSMLPTLLALLTVPLLAAEPPAIPPNGDALLQEYFEREVSILEKAPLPSPASLTEWENTRKTWRGELADMLGLSPMPDRTPLHATKTGEVAADGFIVENLHFQSMPGLYVTANLYRPAKVDAPLPTILYVCGHSHMKAKDGGSLGNKTGYQHHGAWFARHGYVCLVIDTVQLGEIRGEHHGTYSKGRWWWMARGYTPAGVEAWAGIRALDYLETRPEVDKTRMGITGRSGGGAYSWWVAALDDRIAVVAPTAGITTLRNHVVDGAVEGHCDCMFQVNTRRWDYDKVAALIAPRPLLISNTDKDTIFPLDGVMTVYTRVRSLYKSLGSEAKIGLQIAEGPHKDTQPLNVGAFAWFERFLKGADSMALLDEPARKLLDPEALRVFKQLPTDELNTKIDQSFVKAATPPPVPTDATALATQSESWMKALREQVFAGWPAQGKVTLRPAGKAVRDQVAMEGYQFLSQEPWWLTLTILRRADSDAKAVERVVVHVADAATEVRFAEVETMFFPDLFPNAKSQFLESLKPDLLSGKTAVAIIYPRGTGATLWAGTEKQQTHRLRRFYLLGQTLDGMRVWDIRRAIAALREAGYSQPLHLRASGAMAGNTLYASLFEKDIASLELKALPASHATGPVYLNVLKHLDLPQAVAMATQRTKVRLESPNPQDWEWPLKAVQNTDRKPELEIIKNKEAQETPR